MSTNRDYPDQTVRMRMVIWAFSVRIWHKGLFHTQHYLYSNGNVLILQWINLNLKAIYIYFFFLFFFFFLRTKTKNESCKGQMYFSYIQTAKAQIITWLGTTMKPSKLNICTFWLRKSSNTFCHPMCLFIYLSIINKYLYILMEKIFQYLLPSNVFVIYLFIFLLLLLLLLLLLECFSNQNHLTFRTMRSKPYVCLVQSPLAYNVIYMYF